MSGRNLSVSSSWKLLSSTTDHVCKFICSTQEISGVPTLPARMAFFPAVFKMWCTKVVVVVFPFDPVIPINSPSRNRYANSISLHTVIFFARAFTSRGSSAGTPGLGMIRSCAKYVFSWCPPSSSATPASRSFAGTSPNSFSGRTSVAVTIALCFAQNNAVATPVRASPTTSTRIFRNSIDPGMCVSSLHPLLPYSERSEESPLVSSSPQFQSRQSEQSEHQCGNPESHNHFAFAPSQQFKVVVDRRHAEYPLSSQFERTHLQNHRKGFNHEDSA